MTAHEAITKINDALASGEWSGRESKFATKLISMRRSITKYGRCSGGQSVAIDHIIETHDRLGRLPLQAQAQMEQPQPADWLTLDEVALMMKVGKTWVYERKELVTNTRKGKRIYILASDVQKLENIRRHRVRADLGKQRGPRQIIFRQSEAYLPQPSWWRRLLSRLLG